MRYIAVVLVAAWLLLAGETSAHADPISAAIGAISALVKAGGIAAFFIKTAAFAAISMGVSLIQKAMTKTQTTTQAGVRLDVQMGDDLPVSATIGLYATAGKRKYAGTYGDIGGTPNAIFVDVIELGNLPVASLEGLWINDQRCTVLWDQITARGYPILEFRDGTTDYAWIRFRDGTQVSADAYLISKFGDHEYRPWSADMVGFGCPYAVMSFRFKEGILDSMPSCVFEPGPVLLYDVRKDSTNGGSGGHRWDDHSTWEPSYNQAIVTYNVIRGLSYKGQWFFGGQGINALRLPSSSWIAAAQEASRLIDNAGTGSEPQFRCGYEITGDMTPLDVVQELRKAGNARIAEVGGSFKIQNGAFGAAVFAFSDDDIIITEGQSFEPFPTLDETVNAIGGSYPDPSQKWATKDAPFLSAKSLTDAATGLTLFEVDGDRELPVDVTFPAVPFARQVQRLMRAMIKEERRFRTHQFWLPPEAWALEPNDVVSWTSARNGYVNKKFVVVAIEGDMTMTQLVTLKEIDPADYDWSSEYEVPTTGGWLGRIDAPDQPIDGWNAEPSFVPDATGAGRRPAILVAYAGNLDDVESIWVRVRVKATGDIVYSAKHPYVADTPSSHVHGAWCLPGTHYEVTGKYVPYSSRATSWAGWIEVLTDNIRLTAADLASGAVTHDVLADDSVTAAKIANAAVEASKIQAGAVTELALAAEAVSSAKLKVGSVTSDIIANDAIIATKLADAVVTAAKLAAGAVDATKFAVGIEPVTVVSSGPKPTTKTTEAIFYDGQLWTWNGASYEGLNATVGDGSITATQIADGAIQTPKLAANAITADKLAANSVVAGKIAAGAVSTSQLAAGAVVADKIAAGAISADKLAVGSSGKNQLLNTDLAAGLTGWTYWASSPDWNFSIRTDQFAVPTGSFQLLQMGAGNLGHYADLYPTNPANGNLFYMTVAAGKRYELSVYVYGHRADYCRAHIEWRDASGANAGYSWADTPTHQNGDPQKNLANYARVGVIAQAPANAASCNIFFRCMGNSAAYGTEAYTWLAFPYFGEATVSQTELSPWAPTGVTLIAGGNIVTGAITANHLAVNSVTAAAIAGGSITAEKIVGGTITGDKLAGSTITGDKIAANTIYGDKIAANTITAKQLVLTDFSNIVDNGWQNGSLTGWGVSGQTAWYNGNDKGDASGWVFVSNARDQARSLTITVTPGEQYYCEAWVYNYDASRANLILICESQSNGGTSYPIAAYTDVKTAWTRISGIVTIPAGKTRASLLLQTDRGSTGGGHTEWSKPVMRRASGAELIVDGSINANHLAVNSVTANSIAANSVTAAKILAGSITVDKLAAGSVTADKLAAGAITTDKLAAGAITTDKLTVGGVTYDKLATGSASVVYSDAASTGPTLTTAYQNVAAVTANSGSSDVLMVFFSIALLPTNSPTGKVDVQLLEEGVSRLQFTQAIVTSGLNNFIQGSYRSNSSGVRSFTLRLRKTSDTSSAAYDVNRCTIDVLRLNKAN